MCGRPEADETRDSHDDDMVVICWYRVTIIRAGGVIIYYDEEFLYCEQRGGHDIGSGSGGRGRLKLGLKCDSHGAVPRGTVVSCEVFDPTPDDSTNLAAMHYSWSAGDGENRPEEEGWNIVAWEGMATTTRTIRATVGIDPDDAKSWSGDKEVRVVPRSWHFRPVSLARTIRYAPPRGGWQPEHAIWGAYAHRVGNPTKATGGTGPWANEYMSGAPAELEAAIHLHEDFTTKGTQYPGASSIPANDSACNASSFPARERVRTVNDRCGSKKALDDWRNMVYAHEMSHNRSVDECLLLGGAARELLREQEAMTGSDPSELQGELNKLWEEFASDTTDGKRPPLLMAAMTNDTTPNSPAIREWRFLKSWGYHHILSGRHKGTRGCP